MEREIRVFLCAVILDKLPGKLYMTSHITNDPDPMETKYFRTSGKEYCHITHDTIFIFNSKAPTRVPLEHELSEGWGIVSILNYILFTFLFVYCAGSISYYGMTFFKNPVNYGALFLLFISFMRVKEGFMSSRTPTIKRDKIRSIHFKTPKFSYPRLVIYFEGPEGKTLRRTISVLYKKEALPVLVEEGMIKGDYVTK